eukprot:1159758-Pelagomonas_calceolata.AAC.7
MLPHPLAKGRDTPDSLILNGEGEPVPPQREPTPTEPSSTKLREPRIKTLQHRCKCNMPLDQPTKPVFESSFMPNKIGIATK